MSRQILRVLVAFPTIDGAGVAVRRLADYGNMKLLDSFIVMDDFGLDDPKDFMKVFSWNPNR